MVAIKHRSVTGRPVTINDWNQDHVLTGTPGKTLVFGEDGVAVEVNPGTGTGGEPVDLSNYYTKGEIDGLLEALGEGGGGTPTPAPIWSTATDFTIAENEPLSITLAASNTTGFAIVGGDDQAEFEISGTTLRWISNGTKNYELPTDTGGDNTYSVTVRATGPGGISDRTIITTVTDVSETITFPTTTDNTLPVPTLLSATGSTTYPPQFDIGNLADAVVGDVLWIEQRDKAGNLVTRYNNVIDDGEATSGTAAFGLTAITAGTYRYRVFLARGSSVSVGSDVLIHGPDDIEPTLSLPTSSNVQSTSALLGATTDEGNGTLYAVATTTNIPPSALQVESGQNSSGAATPSANVAVTSSGAKTLTLSGMTAATQYYTWLMHKDAAGNRSAVLNGADFTTSAAITALGWQPGSGDGGADGSITLTNSDFTATMTRAEGNRAIYGQQTKNSGKRWIEFTTSYPGGTEGHPGLIDTAANKIVRYQSDSGAGDAGGGGWNTTWNDDRTSTIRFEVDFDTQQIQAFIEGVSAGTRAFPVGATAFKAFANLAYGTGPTSTVNTGNTATVGTPTAGFVAWGAP